MCCSIIISYHYIFCVSSVLGIVWVVLSGVRRRDEMTVTTESGLAVLAGGIRSEIVSQPAALVRTKNPCYSQLRPLRPASLPWGAGGWAGQMQSWQNGPVCCATEGPRWIDWFPQEWARLACTSSRNWKATHDSWETLHHYFAFYPNISAGLSKNLGLAASDYFLQWML